jgi:hypothetical protein
VSLHGELKVNDRVIAEWSARRVNGGIAPDDINLYDWFYTENPQSTTKRAGRIWAGGNLSHRYGDGAAVLAAKVLQAARAEQLMAKERV